jgi:alkylation response protein AidB-like acyl-CoA dehydrogenase
MGESTVDLVQYAETARSWLSAHLQPAHRGDEQSSEWGTGSDDVSIFHNLSFSEERDLLDKAMVWQRDKFDAGYGAITWPEEFGGAGLTSAHERLFHGIEAGFAIPEGHETFGVTVGLIAPTIRAFGTKEQQEHFIPHFLRTDQLCCQLFSEPGAGSDLATLATRADRDGDDWIINGQKVWSSGAQYSSWGELITRTNPDVAKHAGLTAFLIPMDAPGVEVRPIRQMSGGSSFNEVFFTDVRLPDSLRLGDVGQGWKVALTTLGFERGGTSTGRSVGGDWRRLIDLARWLGAEWDPQVRQDLAKVYTTARVRSFTAQRAAEASRAGQVPGPEGSLGKALWTRSMNEISDVVSRLLGPRLIADTGEWGTYAWASHVLGAPGYRIAGGSDEIQRNIIGERVLGLPGEPRTDRGPWRDIPRNA